MNKKYKKLLELQETSVLRKLSRKEVKRPTIVRKLAFFAKQLKSFLEEKKPAQSRTPVFCRQCIDIKTAPNVLNQSLKLSFLLSELSLNLGTRRTYLFT